MAAIGPRKRKALIRELAAGRFDICTLAHDHNLPEEVVAAFMADPETRQMMANIFAAADYGAQLTMARHRTLAAAQLIGLASGAAGERAGEETEPATSGGAGGRVSPEVARRACLDVLKTELARTAGDLAPRDPSAAEDAEQAGELREVLYEKTDNKAG